MKIFGPNRRPDADALQSARDGFELPLRRRLFEPADDDKHDRHGAGDEVKHTLSDPSRAQAVRHLLRLHHRLPARQNVIQLPFSVFACCPEERCRSIFGIWPGLPARCEGFRTLVRSVEVIGHNADVRSLGEAIAGTEPYRGTALPLPSPRRSCRGHHSQSQRGRSQRGPDLAQPRSRRQPSKNAI